MMAWMACEVVGDACNHNINLQRNFHFWRFESVVGSPGAMLDDMIWRIVFIHTSKGVQRLMKEGVFKYR